MPSLWAAWFTETRAAGSGSAAGGGGGGESTAGGVLVPALAVRRVSVASGRRPSSLPSPSLLSPFPRPRPRGAGGPTRSAHRFRWVGGQPGRERREKRDGHGRRSGPASRERRLRGSAGRRRPTPSFQVRTVNNAPEQLRDGAPMAFLMELLSRCSPIPPAVVQRLRSAPRTLGQQRQLPTRQDRHLAISGNATSEAVNAPDFVLVIASPRTGRARDRTAVFRRPGFSKIAHGNTLPLTRLTPLHRRACSGALAPRTRARAARMPR